MNLADKIIESLVEAIDTSKPWAITSSQYLTAKKIKEPWIAEISPMQYARMSKSQKNQYDKKRSQEWGAAAKGRAEWRKEVIDAHSKNQFAIRDPDVTPEARSAVLQKAIDDKASYKKEIQDKAHKENQIFDFSALKKGDMVWDIGTRKYGKVVKISKKMIRVEDPREPQGRRIGLRWATWLSPDDLNNKVKKELGE